MSESKVSASTQDHLDIHDIQEDMVILKNGAASAVIEAGAINFELLSQREQDAAIMAYSGLLNSITFPMQVIIKSRIIDISKYIDQIGEAEKQVESPLLKEAVTDYKNFVQGLVENFSILDKKFYVAVTHNKGIVLPSTSAFGWVKDLFGLTHKPKSSINTKSVIEKSRPQIDPKVEHVIKEFKRINISAKRLNTEELIKFFYESYNPNSLMGSQVQTNIDEYTKPMVESF
jgi:hypothetical protein